MHQVGAPGLHPAGAGGGGRGQVKPFQKISGEFQAILGSFYIQTCTRVSPYGMFSEMMDLAKKGQKSAEMSYPW